MALDLYGHPVETPKQRFYCENLYCPYGPEWDEGKEVTRNADRTAPVYLRNHSTVSQNSGTRDRHCLNCTYDMQKAEQELQDIL
jgi:hypothetical protein